MALLYLHVGLHGLGQLPSPDDRQLYLLPGGRGPVPGSDHLRSRVRDPGPQRGHDSRVPNLSQEDRGQQHLVLNLGGGALDVLNGEFVL